MCCTGIFSYFQTNTSWGNLFKVLIAFITIFTPLAGYFGLNAFTSFWTGFAISFGCAGVFIIGYAFNTKFRCVAHVCLVECFSGFGLTVIFLATSWFSISSSLEGMLVNLEAIQEVANPTSNNTVDLTYATNLLTKIVGIVHYTFAVPFIFLFVHSFVYVCTYEPKKARSSEKDKDGMQYALLGMLKQVKGVIVGSFLTLKLCLMLFQYLLYLVQDDKETVVPIYSLANSVYFVVIVSLFVLAPFSRKILKIRHSVIRSYYETKGNELTAKKRHNIILKDKKDRVKLEALKKIKANKVEIKKGQAARGELNIKQKERKENLENCHDDAYNHSVLLDDDEIEMHTFKSNGHTNKKSVEAVDDTISKKQTKKVPKSINMKEVRVSIHNHETSDSDGSEDFDDLLDDYDKTENCDGKQNRATNKGYLSYLMED